MLRLGVGHEVGLVVDGLVEVECLNIDQVLGIDLAPAAPEDLSGGVDLPDSLLNHGQLTRINKAPPAPPGPPARQGGVTVLIQ